LHECQVPLSGLPLIRDRGQRKTFAGKGESRKTRKGKLYTTGEINRLIDGFIHPLYNRSEWLRLLDGFLHFTAERNAKESIGKFARYNLPELLKKFLEEH
jgi:hypothetical protein